jgi:hypothetical protein
VAGSDFASDWAVSGWLAAVSLVAAAESAQVADIGSQNTVAVAASHAACELLLSLIAGSGTPSAPKVEHFLPLILRAKERANIIVADSFSAQLDDNLRRLNTYRNSALHEGVPVASPAAADACATARELLSLVPLWVNDRLAVGAAGGLASAVAALVDVPEIATGLREAETHLAGGRLRASVEATENTLDLILSRAGLPTQLPRPLPAHAAFVRPIIDSAERLIVETARSAHRDERWILRLALGVRVRDLKRLSAITTSMRKPGGPSRDDAAWALSRVAEMTHRLAMSGALELSWQERRSAK